MLLRVPAGERPTCARVRLRTCAIWADQVRPDGVRHLGAEASKGDVTPANSILARRGGQRVCTCARQHGCRSRS